MAKKKVKSKAKKGGSKKAAKKSKKKIVKKVVKKAAKKKTAKKLSKKVTKKVAKKVVKKSTAKKTKAVAKVKVEVTAKAPTEHAWVGQALPSMVLKNQSGNDINLSDLSASGQKVVFYFYPKDDTPGCTVEACGFRDNFNRFQGQGVQVVGVSPDDQESHQKFIEKYQLNFDLLSDEGHALADKMNVWKEKAFMGRKYWGVERSTFLIKDGVVAAAWQPVKVEGHVDEVLGFAQRLG